ncbi:hypothetical protein BAE44_0020113 [Dichanthelium oligosanthes]|uniref:X8 domain-containing protein n=1 Tax=Dichanthelium oligosanthes TaxID=888268 RepID=A0A1E5V152_9POAL|nr:hypothetical protein BAE44_0020113 [Dichanthelium oligosanthes]
MEAALALVAAVLLLSSTLAVSEFCVCRSDQPTAVLQKAIDFSCGPQGNADCSEIQQGGGCYNPNTVASHCSWATNSYYQNNKARGATCDFGGAATISTTDPSFSGCTFPTSASSAGTTGTTTVGGATSGTLTPGVGTGFNGTSGMGTGSTLGPTGTMDGAAAGLLPGAQLAAFLAATVLSFLALHH